MELKHLTILVEESPGRFGGETAPGTIVAMFNPNRLTLGRTVQWQNQKASKRDSPEMQFTGSDPVTLAIDLLFDTWDTPEPESEKESVKTAHVDRLLKLTVVDGNLHRPPVCRLQWGDQGIFFQGVLQQLETTYTMFTAAGIPVRATNRCTFRQWRANSDDLKRQNLMSSDVAKVRTVRRGETLAAIAAAEYDDPRAWRAIAEANGIDDPLAVEPGMRLVLPARRGAWPPAGGRPR